MSEKRRLQYIRNLAKKLQGLPLDDKSVLHFHALHPSEKLDVLLNHLLFYKDEYRPIHEIQSDLTLKYINITEAELVLVLEQLELDKYVSMKNTSSHALFKEARITFHGESFLYLKDGYSGEKRKSNIIKWAKIAEILALTIGTLMAAIFSGAAFFYERRAERLDILNKSLYQDVQDKRELIDLQEEKIQQSYLIYNELKLLRDSIGKAKK